MVVANHPFGVIDGLVLCYLISRGRSDYKVVAMSTLARVPEMRPYVLPINFADTREAMMISARSRREARALLTGGGCLIIFPSGIVSTARRVIGPARDPAWHPFTARLIIDHRAAVLPVRFEGQNSRLFQLGSRISTTLKLSMLLPEAARRIGSEVTTRIGEVLPFEALREFDSPHALIEHLRTVTYAIEPVPRAATRLAYEAGTVEAAREVC